MLSQFIFRAIAIVILTPLPPQIYTRFTLNSEGSLFDFKKVGNRQKAGNSHACFPLSPFFFFLSGNTSFSHASRHSILTKLCHSDRYLNHYSCTNNDGVRGQDGVTGVKKVIFTKRHQVLQKTWHPCMTYAYA